MDVLPIQYSQSSLLMWIKESLHLILPEIFSQI